MSRPAISSAETRQQTRTRSQSLDPHQQRTRNWMKFLQDDGLLVERVLLVLHYMESQQVDLAILIWAISWNVSELITNPTVRFMRTSLMVSDELPLILARWHKPPRTHGSGTRTKAGCKVMDAWALDTVFETVDHEMDALKPIMDSPQQHLSEESLLGIKWQDVIQDVKASAPTTWSLFRRIAYTPKQDSRNKTKNPDPVTYHHCIHRLC